MGPLIQRTISRLETTKLDQNVKSKVVADARENVYFQLGEKKKNYGGADGRGGYSGLLKTSQDLTVFVSLKTHTTGFTEEGQIN